MFAKLQQCRENGGCVVVEMDHGRFTFCPRFTTGGVTGVSRHVSVAGIRVA
jgi:hypothetical protein